MSSTVQCSHCNKTTTTSDNTQDISLHTATDSSTSLEEKLHNFFQPETLEGDNAYWCEACQESCRATKTLSYTHIPSILIVHLKRLILGMKIQNHAPFETILEMQPYMAPGHATSQKMNLIGVISYQGTKEHGHYVAMTKSENERISHNNAITIQTTQTHLHQSQAYVLMYRKTEQSTGTEKEAPRVIAGQQLPTEKLKPSHKTLHSGKPLLHPEPPKRENPPRQGRPVVGANPNPTHEEPTTVNRKAPETLPGNCYAPQATETRGEGEAGGPTELNGVSIPPTEKADHRDKPPLEDKGTGQSGNEHSNLPQSISAFLHLSQGRIKQAS